MRINRYIALATGMSRRKADIALKNNQVKINNRTASITDLVSEDDKVTINNNVITIPKTLTIMLNKPTGYVCSRTGQGSKTIYDLLPKKFHNLKPIGRLDKNSSGLLLLTNDGELAYKLTHPKFQKIKIYHIQLDKPLTQKDQNQLVEGVMLEDGISKLQINGENTDWQITISEGRNRQIRRTFSALGYTVIKLHRTKFGPYSLPEKLKAGEFQII